MPPDHKRLSPTSTEREPLVRRPVDFKACSRRSRFHREPATGTLPRLAPGEPAYAASDLLKLIEITDHPVGVECHAPAVVRRTSACSRTREP